MSSQPHDHVFGQDLERSGESKTRVVVAVTAVMMVVEICYGILSGSMALLADGLHMASHAAALGINLFAYHYARRHARDRRFSFGTGKVNSLGGYTGAVLLGVFAAIMLIESTQRFFRPVTIQYTQAIWVALVGLAVNGLSVWILGGGHDGHDDPGHDHTHDHHEHEHHDHNHRGHDHHDHNLKSAYLHVLADALTSVLAIVALLAAKYLGWAWMDPAMGIVGALLVLRWSAGLLRSTSAVLLDHQGPQLIRDQILQSVQRFEGSRVTDLHLWIVAPRHYAAIISITAPARKVASAAAYREAILKDLQISHVTIELHPED